MTASTPSDEAIETLLRGQPLSLPTGKVVVERLGANAVRLLQALWDSRAELGKCKGTEQVARARTAYVAAAPVGVGTTTHPAPRPCENASGPQKWRLVRLRCQSIRGIAPVGELFEFVFDGASALIYGPNGTGKSSLVAAVSWVFTGTVATDSEENAAVVPLYSTPKSDGGAAKKLRDWPVVHTLPHGSDPRQVEPDCFAEALLRSEGGRALHLRRTERVLQESTDGEAWRVCTDLASHGISPLDVQLSITAATVFGRRSLEASPDTRHLLSMMLGYDAVEELGAVIGGLAPTLTRAINAEREVVQGKTAQLWAKLQGLPATIREGHPLRDAVSALAATPVPTQEQVAATHAAAVRAVAAAESELAGVLGLDAVGGASAGLADALNSAIATLSRPVAELLPVLTLLDPGRFVPADGQLTAGDALAAHVRELESFARGAEGRIAARLTWWREEVEPGSRSSLLVHVAPYFDPDVGYCPVCERSVRGTRVEARLRELRGVSPESRSELRVFFRDLTDELNLLLPPALLALAAVDPAVRIHEDWDKLKRVIAPALAPLVARYESVVGGAADGLPPIAVREDDPLPAGADAVFAAAAQPFLTALRTARRAVGVARWGAAHLPVVTTRLGKTLTDLTDEGALSLRATLSRGSHAAADVVPHTLVAKEMAGVAHEAAAIRAAEGQVSTMADIRAAVEEVKHIGKYAEAVVEHVFGGIREKTAEHFANLYPNANPDLTLARLHLNKGRDKSVEAYLQADGFEFPGHHVANAGHQRAVALAFFFALLDRHPGGLGFVVMDDPILSLDDNHREAWAANVLRPRLAVTQVLLTTHQRQFLNNCRADFTPGRLVELNPRTRSRRITWRPGDRLDRAAGMLADNWISAPAEMRKYREELLITLDAYSPSPFFTHRNLTDSLDRYAGLGKPHPLAGPNDKIAAGLRAAAVARVLDPALHAFTEADVTEPMVRTCLHGLQELDVKFRKELDRLEEQRLRDLRAKVATGTRPPTSDVDPDPVVTPVVIPSEHLRVGDGYASWRGGLPLDVVGTAAAQSKGCVVDLTERPLPALFPPGEAVLVVGESLSPVARVGQWALLAEEVEAVGDGDYVAVIDQTGNRYLRRTWSRGDAWVLEAVNPLAGVPPVVVRKCACAVRKVIGVLYGGPKEPKFGTGRRVSEWHPRRDFRANPLAGLSGISVRGSSLEPIASDGHVVVVGPKVSASDRTRKGGLAVVETDDERTGNVIKRVYPDANNWILLSPNPIDPRDPIPVAAEKLRAVWPVLGVLFCLAIPDENPA
jgi:ABC-type transport system involved in cytochrome c biogenesis ATPase subunit